MNDLQSLIVGHQTLPRLWMALWMGLWMVDVVVKRETRERCESLTG